ncbi:MAG: type I restriction endonuclease subunit R, EcoR124 family, partial [Alphaproteobacteria bacterium]
SKLEEFMKSQGLEYQPCEVLNLKGDIAQKTFINNFKEVQRLKTGLDQYADLTLEQQQTIEQILPKEQLQGFKGVYIELAQQFRKHQQNKTAITEIEQLDFEFVLFASATIDYDYIMKLIADFTSQKPNKTNMTRQQLISLIISDAKFADEKEEITAYIYSLKAGEGLSEQEIRDGFAKFKAKKNADDIFNLAQKYQIDLANLQDFINNILRRKIFDSDLLIELMKPLNLNWKERLQKESEFVIELSPILYKISGGAEISGLNAYKNF